MIPIPAPGIQQLGGAGNGVLDHFAPGQKIIHQIRNEKQGLRTFRQLLSVMVFSQKLVQGIEKHELDAGAFINFPLRHPGKGRFHHAIRSLVPVLEGLSG